jgi:hypothetical protein
MTMSNDLALRVVLIVDLLLLFSLMAYHRIKAHTNEKLDRRQEGLFIDCSSGPCAGSGPTSRTRW